MRSSVPAQPLIDSALHRMKRSIIACDLLPGEKLKVATLSESLGISSSPIREALNRLTQEGFVSAHDNKGFRVAELSPGEFRDITRLRCILEGEALADAVKYGDDTWEANILGAFHRLTVVEEKLGGVAVALDDSWSERHKAFHFALFSGCPSPLLLRTIDSLFDHAERYRRFSALHRKVARNKKGEHKRLMEMALARDTDQIIALQKRHITATLKHIEEFFESRFEGSTASILLKN